MPQVIGTDSPSIRTQPQAGFRWARLVLAGSMFVMGACGMIYEYCLGVLGNNLIGSSREQIFVIIGLMMFAMGIGASWQQRFSRHLIDRFLWIEWALGIVGGTSTLLIFAAFVWTDSYRLVMYGCALVIGALIGCEIPLLVRINAEYEQRLKANLSSILSMDYVGSLVGALLFTYVLLTRLSLDRISLTLGIVNTVLALGGVFYFWPLVRRRHALLIFSVISLAVLVVGWYYSAAWMAKLEQRCFEDPIIHSQTTTYQHVVLTDRHGHLRMYLDGHLQFSSRDEVVYHELLVHMPMALANRRRSVLILGGGDGLALREVLRYGDVDRVTLVDIDPAIVEMASTHPRMIRINQDAFRDARVEVLRAGEIVAGPERSIFVRTRRDPLLDRTEYELAKVRVITADADQFLRDVRDTYDVVIVDFPDPRSVELAKLYSVPFYQMLAGRMADKGIVSIQSTSPSAAVEVFCCVGRTLEEAGWTALPYHRLVPSFGDWGWHLAWRSPVTVESMRRRIRKLHSFPVPTRYLTPEVARASLAFGKGLFKTAEEVLPNTRWHPVVINYHHRAFR